jgi:GGDEF domain-containing protein
LPSWEITTWIAVGAFALAALLLAASIVLGARLRRLAAESRRDDDAELRSRREIRRAWEEARRERAASTRARSELHWFRHLAEVGGSDSLESALRRILEAATRLGESAAAMLLLPRAQGEPLLATFGLSAEESSRHLLGLPPGGSDARAVSLSYRYTEEEKERDEFRLSGGLALPVLDDDGGRLGTLAVFWRRVDRDVTEEELERLEGLAGALGPSLRNVFRFEELRHAVDRDDTGLPGRRTLGEALAVECARARRYMHPLSLLLLQDSGQPETIIEAASRLLGDVRTHDVVHHLGAGCFAVVLPESSLADAERVARRLGPALGDGLLPAAFVELRFEDDAVSLLERAETSLAGAEQLSESGRFWPTAVEPGG